MKRGLSLSAAVSLVAGSMIGTGIFLKTATMTQLLGSPMSVLLAWGLAGFLSLAGAFVYAEIGGQFPNAGGEYIYLREGYGPLAGFLFGWCRFWIGSPGSVAAYGVGAATFLSAVAPLSAEARTVTAIALVWFFVLNNCLKVAWGGRIQSALTALKVGLIVAIAGGVFFWGEHRGALVGVEMARNGASAMGTAMVSALWAFDGWNNLPMASGEVIDPQKNIPRALIIGSVLVFIVYGLINVAYFLALPIDEIAGANSSLHPSSPPVAALALRSFLGSSGATFLSALFVVSALGAMNGSILTGARVPYAMAKDGLFFRHLSHLHPITCVPVKAILIQGVTASVLAASGTFDQLTDCVVFTSWIFYFLVALSIFRLRNRRGGEAGFRAPFYPVLPGLFSMAALVLLINTVVSDPRSTAYGLIFVVLGIPAYRFFAQREGGPSRTA
ncbi:MAG: amino acid permease [Deltaproteobacteria bacterium]|nr:amino acid permease [Deltaproteobacteria bacterium]